MKRIIAGLLSLVLLLTSFTGVAVAEVKLPYEYAPVTFFLNGQDLEDQFRQWAYETVKKYKSGYIDQRPFSVYEEYDRFSNAKKVFDNMKEEIQYNSNTMDDEDKRSLYIEAILGSLREKKANDPDYLEKYYALSAKDRKKYVLQDGEWQECENLELIRKNRAADIQQQIISTATEGAKLFLDAYKETKRITMPDAKKGFDWAEFMEKIAYDSVKEITKEIFDNIKTECDNSMKKYLAEEIATTMVQVKAADMACLKAIYLDQEYDKKEVVEVARQLYDYYLAHQDEELDTAKTKGKEISEEQEKDILKDFDLQLERTMSSGDFAADIFRTVLKDVIDTILDEGYKTLTKNGENSGGKMADKDKTLVKVAFDSFKEIGKTSVDMLYQNWQNQEDMDFMESQGGYVNEEDHTNDIAAFETIVDQFLEIAHKTDFFSYANMYFGNDIKSLTDKDNPPQTMEELCKRMIGIFAIHVTDWGAGKIYGNWVNEVWENENKIAKGVTGKEKEQALKKRQELLNEIIKEEDLWETSREMFLETFKDCATVISQYLGTVIKEIDVEIDKLNSAYRKSDDTLTAVDKLKNAMKNNVVAWKIMNVASVVAKLAEDAIDVGKDIVKMSESIADGINGEDEISFLAQGVVYSNELTLIPRERVRECNEELFLSKKDTTVEQVWACAANMLNGIKQDAITAERYQNVSIKAYDKKAGGNTAFAKYLRGDWRGAWGIKISQKPYTNILGSDNVLTPQNAKNFRDTILTWGDIVWKDWNDAWLTLPGIDQSEITETKAVTQ